MSKTRYLQRLGQSWYVRVKVPAGLQAQVHNTHIRRALGTQDLDEADRRKWPAVAAIRAEFDRLRGLAPVPTVRATDGPVSDPAARAEVAPPSFAINCTPMAEAHLQSIAKPVLGLDELIEAWLTASDFLKTTKFQRRQAYAEFRGFVGANLAPSAVSDSVAANFVDQCLLAAPGAPSTKRQKLSALAAFWEWLAQRRHVPRNQNPWRGFRLSGKRQDDQPPKKRPYRDEELVLLFSGEPTYPCLREVMALGLFTGARIDELCSLTMGAIRWQGGIAFTQIVRSKTDAGCRTLAISHPVALKIIKRRWRADAPPQLSLFSELKGGGYDKKLSWHVGQAFRRHRDQRQLGRETDFHSLRRTFITRLENLGVDQVRIARYVGHRLPTLAFTVYSGGSTDNTQRETAQTVSYPAGVEAAVISFLKF